MAAQLGELMFMYFMVVIERGFSKNSINTQLRKLPKTCTEKEAAISYHGRDSVVDAGVWSGDCLIGLNGAKERMHALH